MGLWQTLSVALDTKYNDTCIEPWLCGSGKKWRRYFGPKGHLGYPCLPISLQVQPSVYLCEWEAVILCRLHVTQIRKSRRCPGFPTRTSDNRDSKSGSVLMQT